MNESPRLELAHWLVLIAAFLGWMFDGLEMGLFPVAARPALRDIMSTVAESGEVVYPDEEVVGQWYSKLVVAFLLGAASGGLIFGWLGDRIGRVRAMALSIAVYSLFTGCVFFAWAPWQFALFRFVAALGMGGEWALGVALVMECWPSRFRPLLAGVIGAAANFGFLSISLLGVCFTVDENHWRWTMIVGALPGLLAIFVILFIPESQRWKMAVKQRRSQPFRDIFMTRLIRPTLLGICFASVALIGTWAAVSGFLPIWTDQLTSGERSLKVTSLIDDSVSSIDPKKLVSTENVQVTDGLFALDPQNQIPNPATIALQPDYKIQKTTLHKGPIKPGKEFEYQLTITNRGNQDGTEVIVTDRLPLDMIRATSTTFSTPETEIEFDAESGVLVWKLGTLKYKDPKAKSWVQTLLSIGAILGCFLGPLLANWLGRRPAYFLLCLISFVTCGYLFVFLNEYNIHFLAVVGVAGLVSASFYGWLPLYLPELFPTRVRATGQGVSFNFARILAAGGAYLTGALIHSGWKYPEACAVIILIYLVGMVVIWFAPETKGKPLLD